MLLSVRPVPVVVDPLRLDLAIAAVRAAVGAGLLVAPMLVGRILVGDDARRPAVALMARAAGARDIALAIDLVWALDRPDDLQRVHRLHALVDASDAAAAVLGWRHLTPVGRALAVVAGSATAIAQELLGRVWKADPRADVRVAALR